MCGHWFAYLYAVAVALFVTYLHPPSAPACLLSLTVRPVVARPAPYFVRSFSNMSKVVPSMFAHHFSRLALLTYISYGYALTFHHARAFVVVV